MKDFLHLPKLSRILEQKNRDVSIMCSCGHQFMSVILCCDRVKNEILIKLCLFGLIFFWVVKKNFGAHCAQCEEFVSDHITVPVLRKTGLPNCNYWITEQNGYANAISGILVCFVIWREQCRIFTDQQKTQQLITTEITEEFQSWFGWQRYRA